MSSSILRKTSCAAFSNEEADRLLALFSGIFQIVSLDARQQRKVLDLLYEIEDAIRTQQPLYAQFVFGQLLLLLEHWMNTQAVRLSGAEVPDAKHSRISQVLSYLKNHCNERIRWTKWPKYSTSRRRI